MPPRAALLVVLFGFVTFPPPVFAQSSQKPEELAQKSAEAWLSLTDSGKYAESWQNAAGPFRARVSQPEFVSALTGARQPLGELISRKLKSATYAKTLPGLQMENMSSFNMKRALRPKLAPSKPRLPLSTDFGNANSSTRGSSRKQASGVPTAVRHA